MVLSVLLHCLLPCAALVVELLVLILGAISGLHPWLGCVGVSAVSCVVGVVTAIVVAAIVVCSTVMGSTVVGSIVMVLLVGSSSVAIAATAIVIIALVLRCGCKRRIIVSGRRG